MFIGRTDAKAEVPILWPTDTKSWLIRRDPDAGKDWKQEDKGTTKDEMVRGYHRLSGHEFEQTLGDGEGQGSLACCSPQGFEESDMTEWLNNNKLENSTCQQPRCGRVLVVKHLVWGASGSSGAKALVSLGLQQTSCSLNPASLWLLLPWWFRG